MGRGKMIFIKRLAASILIAISSCDKKPSLEFSETNKIKVEIFHSKSASFIHFLRAGFSEPHTSKSIKEIIETNKIDEFKNEQNILNFKKFWTYLLEGYEFKGSGLRYSGFYGEDALIGLSIIHPEIKNFEKNLTLLIPYEGVLAYTRLKNVFFPIFEMTMWKPEEPNLKNNIIKLKKVIKKSGFNSLLEQVKTFYRSEYPTAIPMQLGLVPIPDTKKLKKRHTSAQIIKNIQIVPYFTSKGAEESLDVIFHEFTHALYYTQNQELRNKLNDFYLNNNNNYALFVYRYLDESLATVIGNGIYKEKLDNIKSKGRWYSNKYINGLAKAYYPTVLEYLSSKKTMDLHFMNKTLKLAEKKFPNGPFEIPNNLITMNVVTVHPKVESNFFINSIRKKYRVQSYGEFDNLESNTVNKLFKKKWYNLIVLSKDKKVPKKIAQYFNVKTKTLAANSLHIFRKGGMFLIWIEGDNKKIISKAIDKIKKMKLLPKENKTIPLNN